MAAYYHVESEEELLKLEGNAVLAEIVVPQPEAGPWEQRLEELITAQRRASPLTNKKRPQLTGRNDPGVKHLPELLSRTYRNRVPRP